MATGSKPPGNASWVVGTFVFLRGGASAHRRLRGSDKRPRVDWQGYFKPTMCSFWQFAWMSRLAEMALQCVGMRTSSPGA